ncbi:MAG: mechanosensitive ion channel family protein, partial [Angustibacter sp.]
MPFRALPEVPQWLAREALPQGGRILAIILGAVVLRWIVVRAVRRLAERSLQLPLTGRLTLAASDRLHQRAQTIGSVLRSLITVTVSLFALLLILAEFEINLGPLLASAGVAGVALGFGAQNLVRDFLSGLFIVFEDQYGVGDIVNLGEVSGTVEAISLRTTQLRDATGVTWYVRNGEILRVANLSQGWATAIVDLPMAP